MKNVDVAEQYAVRPSADWTVKMLIKTEQIDKERTKKRVKVRLGHRDGERG